MDRMDFVLLGEAAVYPGHPVTLAYLIVKNYASLSAAQAKGKYFSVVEEDSRLPGAGGHNNHAVQLLTDLDAGKSWEEAVAWADDLWAWCDDQKNSDPKRWREGQDQADKVKPLLREEITAWLFAVEIEYVDLGSQIPTSEYDPYKQLKSYFGNDRVAEACRCLGEKATLETVYAYLVKTTGG